MKIEKTLKEIKELIVVREEFDNTEHFNQIVVLTKKFVKQLEELYYDSEHQDMIGSLVNEAINPYYDFAREINILPVPALQRYALELLANPEEKKYKKVAEENGNPPLYTQYFLLHLAMLFDYERYLNKSDISK